MEVVIKRYKYLPCELEVFTINGINADRDDFGYLDMTEEYAIVPDYSEGCQVFAIDAAFNAFMTYCQKQIDNEISDTFTYTLLTEEELI